MKDVLAVSSKWLLLSCVSLLTTAQCKPDGEAPAPSTGPTIAQVATAPAPAAHDAPAAERVPVDGLPAFGSERALVTIVAFTDYECPYCAKADERITALRSEYGDDLRLVVAGHPLPMHERATPAARAFLAAVEQGKGEAMHTRLFTKRALDDDALDALAKEIGLDVAQFDRARQSRSVDDALARADKLGTSLSVDGTPTFFVNGRRLVGARPIETFRALIDEELVKARALVDQGTPPEKLYRRLIAAAPEASPRKTSLTDAPDVVVDVPLDDAPVRGRSQSPVTIVLFSDFECPYCVKAEGTLRALEAGNPDKIRVAFRHKPLPIHSHARLAAKASLAAEKQGRFWQYHDVLVGHRDALAREDLLRYAAEAGLDPMRFERELEDPALEARIVADEKAAEALGVTGTPTAFVNGHRITGAQPLATWSALVERAASVGAKRP